MTAARSSRHERPGTVVALEVRNEPLMLAPRGYWAFSRKMVQLRIIDGVIRIAMHMIVSIEEAAADPKRGESPLRRSLKIRTESEEA